MRMSQVLQRLREEEARQGPRPRLMHRYASFLPVTSDTPRLSLGEGFTPLVHARNLGRGGGCGHTGNRNGYDITHRVPFRICGRASMYVIL